MHYIHWLHRKCYQFNQSHKSSLNCAVSICIFCMCEFQAAQRVCAVTRQAGVTREIKAPGTAEFSRLTQVTEPKMLHSAGGRFGSRAPVAVEVSGL